MINPKELVEKFVKLKSERGTFESLWQDVAYYCIPRKAIITTLRSMGSELADDVYDSTARFSSQVMAAGLHAYLTNPSSKWFSLRIQDEELMEIQNVRIWLKECEERIYDALNSSNFSQQIYETYRDLGVFGTACLYEEEDEKDLIRFYARPINEIFIVENKRENIEEIYRYFTFTAKQAYEAFGEDAGEKVKKTLAQNPNEKIDFLHWVGRRDIREAGKKDALNKPYASVWIEYSYKHLCRESGYDEFPFFVVRFEKNSMEKYGYSPAINVLPDIRMVNRMMKSILKRAEKIVDPPLDAPDEGYALPLDISANAINYHRLNIGEENLIRPLLPDVSRAFPITFEIVNETREIIKRAFFVDLFLMLAERPKMTATEVMQRVNEKMLILSPVLGRLMSELLDPIIETTFNILMRNNRLPSPPPEIQNQDYVIEYISPLARAQKAYENQSLQQFLAVIEEMSKIVPEVLDLVKIDEVVREYADIQAISPQILRDDAEVQQLRRQRQQFLQTQQALALAKQGADVGEKIANIQEKGVKIGQRA